MYKRLAKGSAAHHGARQLMAIRFIEPRRSACTACHVNDRRPELFASEAPAGRAGPCATRWGAEATLRTACHLRPQRQFVPRFPQFLRLAPTWRVNNRTFSLRVPPDRPTGGISSTGAARRRRGNPYLALADAAGRRAINALTQPRAILLPGPADGGAMLRGRGGAVAAAQSAIPALNVRPPPDAFLGVSSSSVMRELLGNRFVDLFTRSKRKPHRTAFCFAEVQQLDLRLVLKKA